MSGALISLIKSGFFSFENFFHSHPELLLHFIKLIMDTGTSMKTRTATKNFTLNNFTLILKKNSSKKFF